MISSKGRTWWKRLAGSSPQNRLYIVCSTTRSLCSSGQHLTIAGEGRHDSSSKTLLGDGRERRFLRPIAGLLPAY